MTDTPASPPDGATKRSAAVVLGGCCLSASLILLGVIGVVIHFATEKPQSPYRVAFAKAGDPCGSGANHELILDRVSGDILACGFVGFSDADDAPRGVFTAAEVQRITDLSKSLAGNGGGTISAAGQQQVEHVAEDIGRQHGRQPTSPSTTARVTGIGGLWMIALGLALLLIQGLWGRRIAERLHP